ncbi:MAG: hypothetical protein CVT73_07130 [Alphaproteobacteria bacterium HGW-Alphaproteobacteria-12]|nr:MAG: hypothetical protein CVT73_07130 [Alphaproteobacteria bacterium HGW-Alphaproteobacteria-12]
MVNAAGGNGPVSTDQGKRSTDTQFQEIIDICVIEFKKKSWNGKFNVKVRDAGFGIEFLNGKGLNFDEAANLGMRVP